MTESYLSLRKLENNCIKLRLGTHGSALDLLGEDFAIHVKIEQFYGIEINDFAAVVAKTALWIAESQMMNETARILGRNLDFLPLKSYTNIVEGNALRLDWESVVPKGALHYIMGNPPFVGRRYREKEQQQEIAQFFEYKDIDYVACWYYKASQYIQGTDIRCALVSTNSITQGEQVASIWKPLVDLFGIHIDFAYRTFRWDSEPNLKAHVHCVIIGFSYSENKKKKIIFLNENQCVEAKNINGYLLDAPNIFINTRSKPLCNVPLMKNGNVPLDGDALKIELEDYPKFKDCKWIKQLMGGRELLHNEKRYVLWLVGVSPVEILANKEVYKRVELCRTNRLAMKDKSTQKLADTPTTFRDTNNPENYIAMPMVSSENRRYIPMTYLHGDVIPTNQIQTIPDATLYHFGILTSNVHMAWMRAVCGRLEMRYRYSKDIVYNNFPWCNPTDEQRQKIEQTAQAILDARSKYPESSLADLYGETMYLFFDLLEAHRANDRAVMQAYGFPVNMTESECVAELFKLYERFTGKK